MSDGRWCAAPNCGRPAMAGTCYCTEHQGWRSVAVEPGINPKDILGMKKAALRLVPPALTIEVAQVMKLGAAKYGPYNWRDKAVRFTVYLEAILRHTYAAMDGETIDPESGKDHVAHVAACCGIILDAKSIGKLVDDRPKAGAASKLMDAAIEPSTPTKAMRTTRELLEALQLGKVPGLDTCETSFLADLVRDRLEADTPKKRR